MLHAPCSNYYYYYRHAPCAIPHAFHDLHHAPCKVLLNAEVEKKNKYAEACAARRAHFTPLCFSVDGLAGSEANCFLKRMACRLSSRWDRSYAEVLG